MDQGQERPPARLGGGRYAMRELLGRGGMAEVRLADDLRLDRTVAVKTLRPELAGDPSYRARFLREARAAASLNHHGIVAVYDTGEDDVDGGRQPYIVMERVVGQTLAELVHGGGSVLEPARALGLTAQILDALEHAHRSGIVHRDIKPANVMVTPGGAVKVMDFGIARPMGGGHGAALTQTSVVIGTAEYLSPEQARGEEVDARTDVYATGCLLYELLTGRPPFTGDALTVVYQHVQQEPELPSSLVPDLPPPCDTIVLAALAKGREERYQSAEAMRVAIEHTLHEEIGTVVGGTAAPRTAATPPATAVLQSVGTGTEPAVGRAGDRQAREAAPRRARRGWAVAAVLAALVVAGGAYAAFGQSSGHHGAGTVAAGTGGTGGTATGNGPGSGSALGGGSGAGSGNGAADGAGTGSVTADTNDTGTGNTGPVPAPDLVGRTLGQARLDAQAAGMHLLRVGDGICVRHAGAVALHATAPGEPRRVCGQAPAPGTRLPHGTLIRIQLYPVH